MYNSYIGVENMHQRPKEQFESRYVFIDSRDVARLDTNPFEYNVHFEEVGSRKMRMNDKDGNPMRAEEPSKHIPCGAFHNVVSAKLKNFCFPKMNNEEQYVIMEIDEFGDQLDSTDNNGSHRSTAVLYYDCNHMQSGSCKPNDDNK